MQWFFSKKPVPDLKASDFRLFEDGKEQKIQAVTVEHSSGGGLFLDNFGTQEWEGDVAASQRWVQLAWGSQGSNWFPAGPPGYYLITYFPPPSPVGSCHHINVKVHLEGAEALAPDEYCRTPHTPSDPLVGTRLGKQLDDFAGSDGAPKIALSLETGLFYGDANRTRLYVTVEFPRSAIKFHSTMNGLRDEVGILTMAYRTDGTLAMRFSDSFEDRGPVFVGDGSDDVDFLKPLIANHHEAQMELPPGDYNLRVVVSDGTKFGRAQMPLTVDAYDGKALGISSLVLCKQFHDPRQTSPSKQSVPSTLPDFVPLVSKGMEFTPAADTSFTKDYLHSAGLLFAYYEIYEPLLASAPGTTVQTRMRIINIKTGALVTDSGLRSAADWMEAGKSVIPVSEQIAAAKLAKGSYRIEVQASDFAGRNTAWRTATFNVE
jgi:hypothetical protein